MADGSFDVVNEEMGRASWVPGAPRPSVVPPVARRRPSQAVHLAARRPSMRPSVPAKREPAGRPKRPVQDLRTTQLLNEYTPLVHKIASGFQRRLPRNVLREDLVAAGMIGLWDAIRRHGDQPNEGFSWYVRVRVRGAILDELRAQDWLSRRVRKAVSAQSGSEATAPRVVRLDDVSESEQSRCLGTPCNTDQELDLQANREALARAVQELPERERLIVSEHYYKQVKFTSLGQRLGVSEPRVSQLHSRAMKRLKDIVAAQANERF
jgi:RNA polymerase sigma factor for flagellar operon FliA